MPDLPLRFYVFAFGSIAFKTVDAMVSQNFLEAVDEGFRGPDLPPISYNFLSFGFSFSHLPLKYTFAFMGHKLNTFLPSWELCLWSA